MHFTDEENEAEWQATCYHTLVINMRHEPQWSDFLEFNKW